MHAKISLTGENKGEVIEWCEPLPGHFRWRDSNILKAHMLLLKWGREALAREAADKQLDEATSD